MTVVWFVLLVGVLILVHELGHFAWAKVFGVKVQRFSLGLGPKLFGIRRGETDYVVAAIPLGGYVRMLGEQPGDPVAAADHARSFAAQPLWRRVLIVLAGPAMNLAFPVVLYFLVFLGQKQLSPPVIGSVLPGLPADGHLEPGDRVLAIDGTEVHTFYELLRRVERSANTPLEFTVERRGQRVDTTITPIETVEDRTLGMTRRVGRIGVSNRAPLAVVGVVSPSSPAAASHLRTFDRIVAAGGRPIERYRDLVEVLEPNRGSTLPVTYLRTRRIQDPDGVVELAVYEPHVTTLTPEPGPGSGVLRAGLEPSALYVAEVQPGSPEAAAGMRPGDRLLELDGVPIRLFTSYVEALQSPRGSTHAPGGAPEATGIVEHELTFRRGDQVITRVVSMAPERGETELGERYERIASGIEPWAPTTPEPPVPNPSLLTYALHESLAATWDMIELTATSVVRLVDGRLSFRSLGGLLSVLEGTGVAARGGPLDYFAFMAFVSINLGLLNLLPIPLLDGGHLLFLAFEAITRRPPSERVREIASVLGLVVMALLTVLAFRNDVERRWPELVGVVSFN